MSETFSKILESGFTLTYVPVSGKEHHYLVLKTNQKGQYLQLGEVYNPVVNALNINDYDPHQTEKREGRWIQFYSYPQGQNPFDFIASKSFYVADHQEGLYSTYYSPDMKPFSKNLLKEEGLYHDLMGCHASMPEGVVHYIDMAGKEHFCRWKNGLPFSGELVSGYGSNLKWNETITGYNAGKEYPHKIQSVYTREKPTQAFSLSETNGKIPQQISSHKNSFWSLLRTKSNQR